MDFMEKLTIVLFLWALASAAFNPFFKNKKLVSVTVVCALGATVSFLLT